MVTSNSGYDLGMGLATCKQSIRVKESVFAPTSHQKMTIVLWLVTQPPSVPHHHPLNQAYLLPLSGMAHVPRSGDLATSWHLKNLSAASIQGLGMRSYSTLFLSLLHHQQAYISAYCMHWGIKKGNYSREGRKCLRTGGS